MPLLALVISATALGPATALGAPSQPVPKASPSTAQPVPKASPSAPQPVPKTSPAAPQPLPKASPSAPQPVPKASPSTAQPVPKTSPSAPSQPVPKTSPSAPPRFRALVLRSEGPLLADLGAALALRVPDLAIVSESPTDGAPFVFVAVRTDPATPVRHQIGVITSDGAAYFRDVDTGAEPPVRVLASVLANLLVSIAEGSVQPDRTDVEIPAAALPEPAPAPTPTVAPPVTRPVPKTSPTAPRWEYGLVAAGALGLAVGPPRFGRTVHGVGGSLGLDVRGRHGALFGLDLRALGRGADDRTLTRLRIAAFGGYAVRRGRFELPVALGLSVEPWWVSPAVAVAGTRGSRPLFGVLLRASPGLYLPLPARGPLRGLRVGPRLELAGSFLVDDGPRVGGVSLARDGGNTPLLRLGGLELNLALELTLWLGRGP